MPSQNQNVEAEVVSVQREWRGCGGASQSCFLSTREAVERLEAGLVASSLLLLK